MINKLKSNYALYSHLSGGIEFTDNSISCIYVHVYTYFCSTRLQHPQKILSLLDICFVMIRQFKSKCYTPSRMVFMSCCKFWIYRVAVNTKFTWQIKYCIYYHPVKNLQHDIYMNCKLKWNQQLENFGEIWRMTERQIL